ncbi:hypothetical protein Bca52824_047988 [Brassica carinata]|uniref:RNase H type-1 domain-containing protein n=1 Tax=Brassica carinata TaxID=52824 RepID=A0A8X7RMV6_BRACI|nr:hypothetical protein Bca52824_047988 [Brassica carinata]
MIEDSTEWNMELINRILPIEALDIFTIRPSKTGSKDSHTWIPTKSGEYTTKSGYYTGLNRINATARGTVTPGHCDWMSDIWTNPVPPKIRVFLWKIVRGTLPLGSNLATRGLNTNTNCIFCGLEETVHHLFINCQFAASIWEMAPILGNSTISGATTFISALKASKITRNLPPIGLRLGSLFPWIVWTVWTTRNQRIFKNRTFDASETLTKAITYAREWQEAQLEATPSATTETKTAGLAWIFTDNTGQIIHQGSTTEEWVSSPLILEGLAIREALFQAKSRGYTNIEFKSDAQVITRAINAGDPIKGLFGVLQDIHHLTCHLSAFTFLHIPRLDNMATDSLAKRALATMLAM